MHHRSARTYRGLAVVKYLAVIAAIAILVVLLRPMFEATRDGFDRPENSTDKMKVIALALQKYMGVSNTFPPAYSSDKSGNPLLSWRVLILSYLGQDALYREFHLDEPWNSEHNKRLVFKMPRAYRSPESKLADKGMTNFVTVRGDETVFPGKAPITFDEIHDGPARTIAAIEVSDDKAVVWTQPDDFRYDEQKPLNGVLGLHVGGFVAGFADGHVEFMPETIKPQTIKALFTRNGGKELKPDERNW